MIAEERRATLLRELRDKGFVQATALASRMNLSPVTIRRDLALLEKEGFCLRKRGGAVRSTRGVTLELGYEIKQGQRISEKRRIAEAAVRFVQDGDTLILDAGSTTYALALLLGARQRLTVVTNDLQIAVKLASNPSISLICTGGIARPNVYSLQGALAESFLHNLHVDKTFLGADAVHADGTVSNVNIEEVPMKQAMLRAANQVFVLADSSKFDKKGFVQVCNLADVDTLVTDSGLSPDRLTQFQALGLNIILS